MKFLLLVIICVFSLSSAAIAQGQPHHSCGTHPDTESEMYRWQNWYHANTPESEKYSEVSDRVTRYAAISYNLIGRVDGAERVSRERALASLCALNESYTRNNTEILFFLNQNNFWEVNDNVLFDGTTNNAFYNSRINVNKRPNSVNVFVGDVANGAELGVLGFYSPNTDHISIGKQHILTENVIAHEVGHFLSLDHPFYGWEFPNAPTYTPGVNAPNSFPTGFGNVVVERVGNSNCATAADRLCDTEPDYYFGFGWGGPTCNYTANALDPVGASVNPDEDNCMGYFFGCNEYVFSQGQINMMNANLNTQHANIVSANTPNLDQIVGTSTLLAPIGGAAVQYSDQVDFSWTPVQGATHYVLRVVRGTASGFTNSTNSFDFYETVVAGTSHTMNRQMQTNPAINYFWRVTPFNATNGCAAPSAHSNFMPGSFTVGTNSIAGAGSFEIFPNPTNAGHEVSFRLQSERNFDAQLSILDLNGRQMIDPRAVAIVQGDNIQTLATGQFLPGVYIVRLQSEEGSIHRKLVIGL